jgi:mono/diheme cytochrome c family protein
MHDQPKFKPLAQSDFYADQRTARPLVAGTIARGQLEDDSPLFTGKAAGTFVDALPIPLSAALLDRGRERYTIYCTPCHGQTGRGDGMVVRRGFRRPSSFHVDRLRGERLGYYYDVITNGFGAMPDYAAQIAVKDRWAVAAYVRALQLSQYASATDLDPEALRQISSATAAAVPPPAGHK